MRPELATDFLSNCSQVSVLSCKLLLLRMFRIWASIHWFWKDLGCIAFVSAEVPLFSAGALEKSVGVLQKGRLWILEAYFLQHVLKWNDDLAVVAFCWFCLFFDVGSWRPPWHTQRLPLPQTPKPELKTQLWKCCKCFQVPPFKMSWSGFYSPVLSQFMYVAWAWEKAAEVLQGALNPEDG